MGSSPQKQPKRWPLTAFAVIVFLVAAVLAVGYTYSTHSAQEWQATAESSAKKLGVVSAERDDLESEVADLETEVAGLKSEVADLQKKSDDLQSHSEELTSGLDSATERIRSLADEKAQVGDLAAWQADALRLSESVTTQMDTCIADLQELQTYLVDFMSYEPDSLLKYIQDINDGCDEARRGSADLSTKLAG